MSQLLTKYHKYLLMLTDTRCGQRRYSKLMQCPHPVLLAHNYEDRAGFLKGLEVSMEHLSAPLKVQQRKQSEEASAFENTTTTLLSTTNPFWKPNKKCCLISMCCLSRGWIPLC